MTKCGPKLAFLVNLGQAMQTYSMPCWWVDWWLWHAGCISQDTYLLFQNLVTNDLAMCNKFKQRSDHKKWKLFERFTFIWSINIQLSTDIMSVRKQNKKLEWVKLKALRAPCWAVLGCARLYWAALGPSGLQWAVLGCIGLDWAVVGLHCTVLCCSWLYWAAVDCTGL